MLSTRSPKPCKSRWTKSPEGEGPHAGALELWALQDSQQTLPNLLAMPSKPTGGTGGRQDSRHIFFNRSHPFPRLGTWSAGMPQSSSCQLQTSTHADSKAPRGRRDHVLQAARLWIKRERGRQQVFSPHPPTKPQLRLEKSKARGIPVSADRLAEWGIFQKHSISRICWDGYMAVPQTQPIAARCLARIICCLSGQGSSQLMENFDMSNFIVFVQLGPKPNSTEALGWPQKPMF